MTFRSQKLLKGKATEIENIFQSHGTGAMNQEKAFNKLKELLSSTPIIGYPDYKLPFELHTDTSGIEVFDNASVVSSKTYKSPYFFFCYLWFWSSYNFCYFLWVCFYADVIVFSRTYEEHVERLKSVFDSIKESNLKLSPG
jgi:hypothetical protein